MATIADRLTDLMRKRDESFRSLGEKTGLSYGTVRRYANGITEKIPASTIEKLAFALNTNPAYLMGISDDDSIALDKGSASAGFDGSTWLKIMADPQKLAIAQWVADMGEDSLTKVAQILALMLDKEIPSSDQR